MCVCQVFENRLALNAERWAQVDKPFFSAPSASCSALCRKDSCKDMAGVRGGRGEGMEGGCVGHADGVDHWGGVGWGGGQ